MTDRVPASKDGYLLDNRADEAQQRFDGLSALFSPVMFRHVEMLGISEGCRCWEVGVGGPSVPRWLSARVGASGAGVGDRCRRRLGEPGRWREL